MSQNARLNAAGDCGCLSDCRGSPMRIGAADFGRISLSLRGLRVPDPAPPAYSTSRDFAATLDNRISQLATPLSLRVSGFTATGTGTPDPLARLQSLVHDLRELSRSERNQREESTLRQINNAPLSFRAVPVFESHSRPVTSTALSGLNNSQIAHVNVGQLQPRDQLTLQGQVTAAAGAARLTVRGASGATATAGGTYRLTGNRGSTTLVVQAGQSLQNIADQINEHSAATGVAATVTGNDLALASSDIGGAASVQLQPLELEYITQVDGVNAQQVADFSVTSIADGTSETISGSLDSVARGAGLIYHGAGGGFVAGTATFRLTGAGGSTNVSINQGESLADVVQRINQDTATTGVIAAVDGDDLHLTSDTIGAGASVQIDSIVPQYDKIVSGVNATQIPIFNVVSLADGSQHALAGQVTRSASGASLALQGSTGGTVIDTATFQVTGSLGSASISITQGESLAAVAGRVNAAAGTTGVTAAVSGNQLVFTTSDVGSAAHAAIALTHVNHTNVVSGVNASQLTAFQVNSFTEGATQTLNGSITQTAGIAELSFTGTLGLVGRTATFTLSGSQGSTPISVTPLQSLSSLASAVNAKTAITGVSAVVQGQQVKFRSVGAGSSATVAINVTSGTFPVTGGNGNGTANGTNGVAIINGQTVTGAANDYTFSDAKGNYSFTAASGFTGAFSPVTIVSQAGSFVITGGNGDGTATGLDAQAVINGSTLTGVANRFSFNEPGGQFEIEFAPGFTGTFDAIHADSVAEPFDFTGGDAAGRSVGADAVATINGVEHTSADGRFTLQGTHGTYEIEFASGFTGMFDQITAASIGRQLDVIGGNAEGLAYGTNAEAIINGQSLIGDQSLFRLATGGHDVVLEFQPGFVGQFDPITATLKTHTVTETVQSWRQVADGSLPFADSAEDEQQADPLNVLLDELDRLTTSPKSQSNLSRPVTQAEITIQSFAALSQEGPLAAFFSADPQSAAALTQLRHAVDLLA
jgi:hypothetical protein